MPKPYPREFREDVVAVARGREPGVTLEQMAGDFGVHPITLSKWLRRPDVNDGVKPGVPGDQPAELREARKRIRLVERDRELERIGEFLSSARKGRGGELVVEGPAGIGKTVLLAAGRDVAVAEGFRVLRARGAELEREFAFGVVYQLFEPVIAAAAEEGRRSWLDGPPGVAARLLGLPEPGGDPASAAAVAPDPSFAVLH